MRISKWQFNPTRWPTLTTLTLLAILVLLGVWQLRRADYKRALLAEYHQSALLPPVSLNQILDSGGLATLGRYRHVQVQGHYDGIHQVLLQNMQYQDQAGYEVLTPFVLATDQNILLVDRGFIPRTPGTKTLPNIVLGSGRTRVSGVLGILPVPGIRVGNSDVKAGWPKLMLYPRYQTLVELYGSKLLKPVLLLDADQADGFVRDWQPDIGFPPVRHDAYALQWFALALALLIIWIVVNSKWDKHE
jgi:surfeit locus 1 family protein